MKRSTKATLLMTLLALSGGPKGAAIEREGTILSEPFDYFGPSYPLDLNADMIDDCVMYLSPVTCPPSVVTRLSRYLNMGTRIIFEDDGLGPNEDFGAGRMIGFFTPDGRLVRLDQMFSQEIIRQYFPLLWQKILAEQRTGR
jgi:hypothetical protein